jgi:UDP-2,4-diacetamido-2,4,6-trideoxy-beta-L-altropyranose hydrolase
MKVAFRVDSSLDMGTGHVMRCLTLAAELKKMHVLCVFLCRPHKGNIIALIQSSGFEVIKLSEPQNHCNNAGDLAHGKWLGCSQLEDANQVINKLDGRYFDCLIVDHYALDVHWEKAVAPLFARAFVIDDLADRKHACFALLDQNYGRTAADYSSLVPSECTKYIGLQYSLLRQEFSEYRKISIEQRTNKKFEIKTILLNMGGIDKENYTGKILKILSNMDLSAEYELVIILGANCPNIEAVKEAAEKALLSVDVLVGVNNMAQLMSQADLAIGAAGSSTWERFCLGIPSVLVAIADNQRSALQAIAQSGLAFQLSAERLSEDLPNILLELTPTSMAGISSRCSGMIDGNGINIISNAILNEINE